MKLYQKKYFSRHRGRGARFCTFAYARTKSAHIPVLLNEVIEILDPQPGEFFIDGTIGSGGHSSEILKKIGPTGKLLGIDWDKDAIENFELNLKPKTYKLKAIKMVHGNYADLPEILSAQGGSASGGKKQNLPKANGLILDLGFSSEQLESGKPAYANLRFANGFGKARASAGKGFSFQKDEILDMRYNSESGNLTAAEVLNQFSEKELADIFYKYGEERLSRRIAKKIIEERKKERILTTFDLVGIIKKAVPRSYERGRLHPATRVFQALRIYVNRELENLEAVLKNLEKIVKNRGRVAIISFHSLEDRMVKNYFRQMEKEGRGKILTKKPIRPTNSEVINNHRSRSAKLRAIILN